MVEGLDFCKSRKETGKDEIVSECLKKGGS